MAGVIISKGERMSSLERPLAGSVLVLDLPVAVPVVAEEERTARTLVKNGPLRVTVVTLRAGGGIPTHRADGPITVQPLAGRIRFTAAGQEYDLGPGQILALDSAIDHAVVSDAGATFLLTLARAGAGVV
jgi:quercetin dioxygenase-like cupin family protein